jgi:E3 ubiquitin-protein ligase RNF14
MSAVVNNEYNVAESLESLGISDDELLEQLEALKSIYPELRVDDKNKSGVFKLELDLDLEAPLSFSLVSNDGKVLSSISSRNVDGIELFFDIPITRHNYELRSSWIDPEVIHKIKAKIDELITQCEEMTLYAVCDFMAMELTTEFKDSLFEDIQTSDFRRFREIALMCERSRVEKFQKSRFDCSICLENKEGRDGALLHCDHAFCYTCLQEYIEKGMKDDFTKIQCPNCPIETIGDYSSKSFIDVKRIMFKERLTREDFLNVLTEEEYTNYDKQRKNVLFEKFHQMYPIASSQCPRCHNWLFHDDPDDPLMRCRQCELAYCFYCKHSWHGTTNECGKLVHEVPPEIVEMLIDSEDSRITFERYAKQYGLKTLRRAIKDERDRREMRVFVEENEDIVCCPKCEMAVTKSDGCNKMQCGFCKQNFCYLCGLDLFRENPYTHFNDYRSPCYGKLFEGLISGE